MDLTNLNFTIDSFYKALLERLTDDQRIKDVSFTLLSAENNEQRVLYVYEIIKNYKLIPLIGKVIKCPYVSTHYRNLGNLFYQRADVYLAWQYFNLALMYSPLDLDTYPLAISNRSAVFAVMKKYKECLEDIKMVFSKPYPAKLRDKLLRRKQQCEEALKEVREPDFNDEDKLADDIFKFKGPKNERYVSASTKLSVMHTQELGRHVVAQEDIEVGEIIVQEDPFVKVLLKTQYVFTCACCLSRSMNLYPCPFCCQTMYCSQSCADQAYEEYHSFECPILAGLLKMHFTKLELLALRVTIKARTEHDNWDSVFSSVEAAESTVNTENWGFCKEGDKWVYDSKYYASIHNLATNLEKRDISDVFQKCVSAAVLTQFLAAANFLDTNVAVLKRKIINFTAGTLLHHLMTAPTNMHGISTIVENNEGNYIEEYNIGSAAYAFLSLINHSCAPNVVRFNRLGNAQVTLIALRPIKKGMQIFDNYGYNEVLRDEGQMASEVIAECIPSDDSIRTAMWACGRPIQKAHHAIHSKTERQAILRSQYKFICVCEACTDDWPVYQELAVITSLSPAIVKMKEEYLSGNVIEALQKGDRNQALKLFKPLCELATALDPYIPCKDAAECQETLKQCLSIISGVLPNSFSKFAVWNIPPPHITGQADPARFFLTAGSRSII